MLGILTRHRDKMTGVEVATFFCSQCCVEFTAHNGLVVQVTTISPEGETSTYALRDQTGWKGRLAC